MKRTACVSCVAISVSLRKRRHFGGSKWLGMPIALLTFAVAAGLSPAWAQGGPPVYVSTFDGGQILRVDGTTGATTVLNTSSGASPEDVVVGTDAKIYVCDALNNRIRRMNQDGTQVETVYDQGGDPTKPSGPEGPSVSTTGDLFFNTRGPNHTGVWKIPGVFAIPFDGGPFPAPVQVLTHDPVANGTGSMFGEGTAFDQNDAVLVVDRSGATVVKSSSPFTSTSTLISSNLNTPIGIAVDSAGDIFVADRVLGVINRFNSAGVFQNTYVSFTATSDDPLYLQFDGLDKLYVATAKNEFAEGGKVWRVDPSGSPPTTGTATLLIDLSTVEGLASNKALGLAVPPTGYPAIALPLNPNGGTNRYRYANDAFNYEVTYGTFTTKFSNVNLVVQAFEMDQPALDALTADTGFAGVKIVPYAGTGGYGIRFDATCQDASTGNTIACPITVNPYLVQTSWNGQAPTQPGFLKGPVGTAPYETNIFTGLSAQRIDPTGSGRTCCGFSKFQFVDGVTGTAPTITITTPANNATYLLNQTVLADYFCSGTFVVNCLGTVSNGSAIDTASVGTKTFEVNAVVSAGPAADKTVTYQVAFNTNGCLLYDTTKAAQSGSVIPIKLQLCDANGIDVSSPSLIVHAVKVVKISNSMSFPVMHAGNANPHNDFRFDSTLGPTGGYIFNLKTSGLTSGSYNLNFTVTGDPTTHAAPFAVR